jgi:uncharacterized membrane protein YphA (DoxX/SURF4 family)
MDVIVLVGRVLFVVLFISSGLGHFRHRGGMSQYAKAKGLPAPVAAVIGSGIIQLAAGLSILLGIWADLGALLLVVFLLPTALLMHAYWKETDPQARVNERIQFNKDLALAGASLMLFAFFAKAGDNLGLTLTGPLVILH